MKKTIAILIGLLMVLSIAPITDARMHMTCEGHCGGGSTYTPIVAPVTDNGVSHQSFNGNLDKRDKITIREWKSTVNSEKFVLDKETYRFNFLGINFLGREVVRIYDNDDNILAYTWLKKDTGILKFWKDNTKEEKTAVKYEVGRRSTDRMLEIELSKLSEDWNDLSVTQKNWLIAGGNL
jgi:hypothetical protein